MFRVCVIPLFVGLAAVSTQERGSVQSPGASTPVFSSRALPEEAFRIFEDGTPQRIEFFTGEDAPVTVGFLVDSSGSMREGRQSDRAQDRAWPPHRGSHMSAVGRSDLALRARLPGRTQSLAPDAGSLSRPSRGRSRSVSRRGGR